MLRLAALVLASLLGGAAVAQAPAPDPAPFGLDQREAISASRAVIGSTPRDHAFIDSQGRARRLAEFRGQPVLLNFVYTGCFKVCPTSARALRQAVVGMRERFGTRQFQIVSIGFDQPTDSPMAMRDFAARQRIDDANWSFLTPRAEDVPALAADFGFQFVRTPMGYDHTLQVSLLDAEGRIHEQVYGDAFGPDSLGEPLRRMLTGATLVEVQSVGDFIDRFRILCSVYDPVTGQYRTDWGMYLEIAGGLTFVFCMMAFALSEWRANRRRRALDLSRAALS
jgi:protein SCO1/2